MKIALGSDHAGFAYKEKVKALLLSLGHEVKDFGTDSDAPVPYPEYVRPAAQAVAGGECERGIVLGGAGNGKRMGWKHATGRPGGLIVNLPIAVIFLTPEAAQLTPHAQR